MDESSCVAPLSLSLSLSRSICLSLNLFVPSFFPRIYDEETLLARIVAHRYLLRQTDDRTVVDLLRRLREYCEVFHP